MMNIVKKGLVILGILFASNRIERLDNNDDTEIVNVSLKFSE